MATRFELWLNGDSESTLLAAAEEALDEIELAERWLSLYRADSDIAQVNQHASNRPVRIDPRAFRLVARAQELNRQTCGAFDPTVAPLLLAWGLIGGPRPAPSETDVDLALQSVGFEHVRLDPAHHTVAFAKPGMWLDLGSIGKGYAIDRACELLREAGIESGLIHGGTSTVYGLGRDHRGEPWKIAVNTHGASPQAHEDKGHPTDTLLVTLEDAALSVSSTEGKRVLSGAGSVGHVLDPRTGRPLPGQRTAAVRCASATDSDALSTGLLVLGQDGFDQCRQHLDRNHAWVF